MLTFIQSYLMGPFIVVIFKKAFIRREYHQRPPLCTSGSTAFKFAGFFFSPATGCAQLCCRFDKFLALELPKKKSEKGGYSFIEETSDDF